MGILCKMNKGVNKTADIRETCYQSHHENNIQIMRYLQAHKQSKTQSSRND
jgi:hypothetical protein